MGHVYLSEVLGVSSRTAGNWARWAVAAGWVTVKSKGRRHGQVGIATVYVLVEPQQEAQEVPHGMNVQQEAQEVPHGMNVQQEAQEVPHGMNVQQEPKDFHLGDSQQ